MKNSIKQKDTGWSEKTGRKKELAGRIAGDAFKIFIMLLFVFPFFWMITTAFKTYSESILIPPTLWPRHFTLDNFRSIAQSGIHLGMYAKNSIIVTLAVIVLQTIIMIPAAYAFAIRKFPGSNLLFGIVLIAFMIPQQISYITVYLMFSKLHMINSLWPQILPFGANAFGIFLLRQRFRQIPREIIESARLDSATEWDIMMHIAVPMCRPTMITIAMFSFIDTWNSYFWPLVMTNNDKYRPLTLYIEKLKAQADTAIQWNEVMAGNFILVVPVIIIFIFASKKIIEAYAYNGMK